MPDPAPLSLDPGTRGHARLLYFLYLAGLVTGLAGLAGAVMAWIARDTGDAVLRSHYANQVNIFWKMLAYLIIGGLLAWILVGILVIAGAIVWYILRVMKGLEALSLGKPAENPESWLF